MRLQPHEKHGPAAEFFSGAWSRCKPQDQLFADLDLMMLDARARAALFVSLARCYQNDSETFYQVSFMITVVK